MMTCELVETFTKHLRLIHDNSKSCLKKGGGVNALCITCGR